VASKGWLGDAKGGALRWRQKVQSREDAPGWVGSGGAKASATLRRVAKPFCRLITALVYLQV